MTPFGVSSISNADIVTRNELTGLCERFNTQPSGRKRIVIARSVDPNHPAIRQDPNESMDGGSIRKTLLGGGGGAETDRPKLGPLDSAAFSKLNITHHF